MEKLSQELAAHFSATPVHAIGELLDADAAQGLVVRTQFGELSARRAASCLLEPRPGDSVLVSGPTLEAAWIIAVLERQSAGPARLSLEGDAELTVTGNLSLRAEQSLRLEADALTLRAREGTALIDRFHAFGREFTASVGQLKLVGNLLETFVERVTQFAKMSLRTVEGCDQLRSGVVDYQAEQTLNLRGREIVATAEELVKIDGGQIHLG
jgi:hypothetical protein